MHALALLFVSTALAMGPGNAPRDVVGGIDSFTVHCDADSYPEGHGDFADALNLDSLKGSIQNETLSVSYKIRAAFCEKVAGPNKREWVFKSAFKGEKTQIMRWKSFGSAVEYFGYMDSSGVSPVTMPLSNLLTSQELAQWRAGKKVKFDLALYYWMKDAGAARFSSAFLSGDSKYDFNEKVWMERNLVNFVWHTEIQGNQIDIRRQ